MLHPSLPEFLAAQGPVFAKGPLALIFAEDEVELASTLQHHLDLGFAAVILLAGADIALDWPDASRLHRVTFDIHQTDAVPNAVNRVIAAVPGAWVYYCHNAEYLFFPFCETRNIRELLAFHAEERREAMLTYVIDLYAENLDQHPDAVDRASAMLDRTGYYALGRGDSANNWAPKERQMDFFGGLRWRFEEHIPWARRRIDRIGLFKAQPGLKLLPGHLFNLEEYNTYACPWHNNLTAAICSFRTAKALRSNPGSRFDIQTFRWGNSVRFDWHSRQLLDLGLMEPGQWF